MYVITEESTLWVVTQVHGKQCFVCFNCKCPKQFVLSLSMFNDCQSEVVCRHFQLLGQMKFSLKVCIV